jgi:2'-5' RNA ligase
MAKYFIGIEPEYAARKKYNKPNAHVTLEYLGDTLPENTINNLKEIAKRNYDFNVRYNTKGISVKGNRPVADFYTTSRLSKLQQDIHKNIGDNASGYFDKILYEPHISLDINSKVPRKVIKERVDKIYLYKDNKKIKGFKLKDRGLVQKIQDVYYGE